MTRILLFAMFCIVCATLLSAEAETDSGAAADEGSSLMRRDRIGLSPKSIADTFKGVDLAVNQHRRAVVRLDDGGMPS